ncbi:hypothetical protein STSP2_02065 [Anaerohalosphaera lusitana]|uniref:DUF4352 domain-containing protein n=1 Tax=Anaerohalosphaera lusitana TaxID=1936003 RepID=A0A1U9NMD1_9BACT|nr:DUF308 domain-containing protein [Anaerohalosphaera lusitana]AQT68888.1 hypothetical protein STSP2_02065 [Anaerohalosphaera lusitana]
MIEFECNKCGKQLRVKDESAGKKGKCPRCRCILEVPAPDFDELIDESPVQRPVEERFPVTHKDATGNAVVRQKPHESGHSPNAPSVNVNMPKRTSSLGVVSLIMGILAFLICWIPLLGLLSIPVSSLGVLFAVIGFLIAIFRKGSGIGWPIGGGVVSALALIIAFTQVAVIGGAAEAIDEAAAKADQTKQEVVTSSGSGNSTSNNSEEANVTNTNNSEEAEEWVSAKYPVRQGDMQLQVKGAVKGKVPLIDSFDESQGSSRDDLLAIYLELINGSQSKKIEYQSWQGQDISFSRDYATLEDNFGNRYKRISFGFGTEIVGNAKSDSIYPGKSLIDVLVFELPVDTAEHLKLELPADNFGGEGMLRLQIPQDMIQNR